MKKNNLKKFITGTGLALGITVAATGLNTGAVTAASIGGIEPLAECNHSYVYVFHGSTIRLTSTHEYRKSDGVWRICTVNRIVDTYIGKCTKCGQYGGQGYIDEYLYHVDCGIERQELY